MNDGSKRAYVRWASASGWWSWAVTSSDGTSAMEMLPGLGERQQSCAVGVGGARVGETTDVDTEAIGQSLSPQRRAGSATAERDVVVRRAGERGEMGEQPRRVHRDTVDHGAGHVASVCVEAEVGEAAADATVEAGRHRADQPRLEQHAVGAGGHLCRGVEHALERVVGRRHAEAVVGVDEVVDEHVERLAADAVLGDEEPASGSGLGAR